MKTKIRVRPKSAYGESGKILSLEVESSKSVAVLKEQIQRMQRMAMMELYYKGSRLAEERSFNLYNVEEEDIIETCSNTEFATILYAMLNRAKDLENLAANKNHKSIHGDRIITLLQMIKVMFNSSSNAPSQPRPCHTVEEFAEVLKIEYQAHYTGKRGLSVPASFEKKLNDGHMRFLELVANDCQNPCECFTMNMEDMRKDYPDYKYTDRGLAGSSVDESELIPFCSMPMICHCGERRPNQVNAPPRNIAPPPTPDKIYSPEPFRVPFALLAALSKAQNERYRKLSLEEEEFRDRAQKFTDSDMHEASSRMKPFESAVQQLSEGKNLIQREAGHPPVYSLRQDGEELAQKCMMFVDGWHQYEKRFGLDRTYYTDELVVAAVVESDSPSVKILVDDREPNPIRVVQLFKEYGVKAEIRKLPVGDFIVVKGGDEKVLPAIVERKTWLDLVSSLNTRRFQSQIERMLSTGLGGSFYLVETSPPLRELENDRKLHGITGAELESKLEELLFGNGLFVTKTSSLMKTVKFLTALTHVMAYTISIQQTPAPSVDMNEIKTNISYKQLYTSHCPLSGVPHKGVNQNDFLVLTANDSVRMLRAQELLSFVEQRCIQGGLVVVEGARAYNMFRNKLLKTCFRDYLVRCKTSIVNVNDFISEFFQTRDNPSDSLCPLTVHDEIVLLLQCCLGVYCVFSETQQETEEYRRKWTVSDTHWWVKNNHDNINVVLERSFQPDMPHAATTSTSIYNTPGNSRVDPVFHDVESFGETALQRTDRELAERLQAEEVAQNEIQAKTTTIEKTSKNSEDQLLAIRRMRQIQYMQSSGIGDELPSSIDLTVMDNSSIDGFGVGGGIPDHTERLPKRRKSMTTTSNDDVIDLTGRRKLPRLSGEGLSGDSNTETLNLNRETEFFDESGDADLNMALAVSFDDYSSAKPVTSPMYGSSSMTSPSTSTSTKPKSASKCGNCRHEGHVRSNICCPYYNSREEREHRRKLEERREAKLEAALEEATAERDSAAHSSELLTALVGQAQGILNANERLQRKREKEIQKIQRRRR